MLTQESEPEQNKPVPQPTELKEIETVPKELAEATAKADKYLANWQRAEADLINYKRHCEQEKEEIRKFANTTLVLELLPFLDDLKRAFTAIPPPMAEHGWAEGIKLAGHKLQTILERQGLSPIKAVGEPFDPRFHEAISQGKGKEGMVISEIQKGYLFRDKVIRPTKVVVGNGEEE